MKNKMLRSHGGIAALRRLGSATAVADEEANLIINGEIEMTVRRACA